MCTLSMEHPSRIMKWKRALDGDPVGREKMKVRRYQILRPLDTQLCDDQPGV
ncbi:MAG: hypothetical protein IPL78_21635 [Chloroflexi bacterium]|nr:hypothetical protein [Chloroflexota bacterium]